tara:strand:+ start:22224 stop:22586 length:363 start_codon:yes stop_codon:yes gene_type:complete
MDKSPRFAIWSTLDPAPGPDEVAISAWSTVDLSQQSENIVLTLQALAGYVEFSLPTFTAQHPTIIVQKIGAKSYKWARINERPGSDDVSISVGVDYIKVGVGPFNKTFEGLIERWRKLYR